MSNNPQNIRLSACYVRWGGRDLGLTKGGVDVTIKTSSKMIQVDQFGASTVTEYVTGREITVKTPFAETDIDTLYSLTKTSGANFNDNGTIATGTVTFAAGQPTNNQTLTLNGHVFTFVTVVSTTSPTDQILIGTSVAQTIANALAVIGLSNDPNVQAAVYASTATTIAISYYRSGVIGNCYMLATNAANVTVSGATLTGGVDGTVRNVSITTGIGINLLSNAQPLVLHPINRPDGDTTEDFTVPLANTPANIQFAYKFDNERIFTCDFTGYPNASTGVLCTYGH